MAAPDGGGLRITRVEDLAASQQQAAAQHAGRLLLAGTPATTIPLPSSSQGPPAMGGFGSSPVTSPPRGHVLPGPSSLPGPFLLAPSSSVEAPVGTPGSKVAASGKPPSAAKSREPQVATPSVQPVSSGNVTPTRVPRTAAGTTPPVGTPPAASAAKPAAQQAAQPAVVKAVKPVKAASSQPPVPSKAMVRKDCVQV